MARTVAIGIQNFEDLIVERLLQGEVICTPIDEQIVYNQIRNNDAAIWSLLLASGYLKVLGYEEEELLDYGEAVKYELMLTNYEVQRMFGGMVRSWFQSVEADYNDFIKAMLVGDRDAMNHYMNKENCLEDTVREALRQIQERQYVKQLVVRGIAVDHIRCYGLTFQGKRVLIG